MSDDYSSTTGASGASGVSGSGSAGSTSGFGSSGMGQNGFGQSENIQNALRTTQERMQQARHFVTAQAQERPMVATAVAVGAGMLVGLMLGGGSSRR